MKTYDSLTDTDKSPALCWHKLLSSFLCAALIMLSQAPTAGATTETPTKPRVLPSLIVSGTGALPQSRITLTFSPTISVAAQSSENGDFTFPQVPYDYRSRLTMQLSIPVAGATKSKPENNTLILSLQPRSFVVRMEGTVSKAASIALATSGNGSSSAIANMMGGFRIASPFHGAMKPERTSIVASVMNVREECCPRALIPASSVTVSVRGSAVALPPLANLPKKSTPVSANLPTKTEVPVSRRVTPEAPAEAEAPAETPAKVLPKPLFLPFGRSGELTYGETTHTASLYSVINSAYSPGTEDGTWVEGLRLLSRQIVATIMLQGRMIGGFIDAQVHLDTQRALQKLTAEAINDYIPSEALCKFGSLSKSLAASEGRSSVTKIALNEALGDRETMRKMTAYGLSPGSGDFARVRQYRAIYCDKFDESNALETFCDTTVSSKDFNKDVDYTRLLDVPLTLPVNFTGTAPTADQLRGNADVIAFANNLFAGEVFRGFSSGDFEKQGINDDDVQNYRSVIAARSVVRNSFTSLVGMKAEGTAGSNAYMRAVVSGLGLPTADVDRLIGNNPSYFAQMEVLTKKIYQDPAFFVNLYERPANIDRQRAAMQAVNLQQQTDLLNVLRRREMLLSVLLELRIKNLSEVAAN